MPQGETALGYVWRVLLWLPVTFAIWFFLADVITAPLVALVRLTLRGLYPEAIASITQQGYLVEVMTRFAPPRQPGVVIPAGEAAGLALQANPLVYSYNLPLLVAMILAAPGSATRKLVYIAIGAGVLLLVQAWGVHFDVLKTLVFGLGPEIARRMHTSAWSREVIAFGYQFGCLILAPVAPVVLWIAMYRHYVAELVPRMPQPSNTRPVVSGSDTQGKPQADTRAGGHSKRRRKKQVRAR